VAEPQSRNILLTMKIAKKMKKSLVQLPVFSPNFHFIKIRKNSGEKSSLMDLNHNNAYPGFSFELL